LRNSKCKQMRCMNAKASDSEPERKKIHAKFIRRNVPKAFITVRIQEKPPLLAGVFSLFLPDKSLPIT